MNKQKLTQKDMKENNDYFSQIKVQIKHTKKFKLTQKSILFNNKDLLTECEVCTGKYCLRFSYRPSDEGARPVR